MTTLYLKPIAHRARAHEWHSTQGSEARHKREPKWLALLAALLFVLVGEPRADLPRYDSKVSW